MAKFGLTRRLFGVVILSLLIIASAGPSTVLAAPPNDNFADATLITSLPYGSGYLALSTATSEAGEPKPSCGSSPTSTAWFSYTPSANVIVLTSYSDAYAVVVIYTGSELSALTEVECGSWGITVVASLTAGTTYYFQVSREEGEYGYPGAFFGIQETPPPIPFIHWSPTSPSTFDSVPFGCRVSDPADIYGGDCSWNFGDGVPGTGCDVNHQFSKDGDYTVTCSYTSSDGRTGDAQQVVRVRTRDVAITKFTVPHSAGAGQTREIVVGLRDYAYPETVRVQLFKSVVGGFTYVDTLFKEVQVLPRNRTTDFLFTYLFTSADAKQGTVTFKAVAEIQTGRDAVPADNEAISLPTKVTGK